MSYSAVRTTLLLALALGTSATVAGCADAAAPNAVDTKIVGNPAPPFALDAVNTKGNVSMASLQGQVVIVDYARPWAWNPLRWLFQPVLARLEPFALDLWRKDLSTWTPPAWADQAKNAQRYFGGLYQKVVITR